MASPKQNEKLEIFEDPVEERREHLIKDSSEIEELILKETKRIKGSKSKKRADTNLICQSLERKHGLLSSTVRLQLSYMIKCGQIENVPHRGAESLWIVTSDRPTRKKDQNQCEETQISSNSIFNDTNKGHEAPSAQGISEEVKNFIKSEIKSEIESSQNKGREDSPEFAVWDDKQKFTDIFSAKLKDFISFEIKKALTHTPPSKSPSTPPSNLTWNFLPNIQKMQEEEIKFLREEMKNKNEIIKSLLDGPSRTPRKSSHPNPLHHFEGFEVFDRPTPNVNNKGLGEWQTVKPRGPSQMLKPSQKNQNPGKQSNRYEVLSQYIDAEDEMLGDIYFNGEERNATKSFGKLEKANNEKRQPTGKNKIQVNNGSSNNKKRSVVIVGDSIAKHVEGKKLKQSLKHEQYVHVKCFPGAKTSHMTHYIKPHLEQNPDMVILHTGCNDINSDKTPTQIAVEICNLAAKAKTKDRGVAVSSLIPRGDSDELNEKTTNVNEELKYLCKAKKIDFIDHVSIEREKHINNSKIHLNRFGTIAFAKDFLNYLKH